MQKQIRIKKIINNKYGGVFGTGPKNKTGKERGLLQQQPRNFVGQHDQLLVGEGFIRAQAGQLLLHAGNFVRRDSDARQLLFEAAARFACPSRDTARGSTLHTMRAIQLLISLFISL